MVKKHDVKGRSEDVFEAIRQIWREKRQGPTIREIGEITGIESTSHINFHLDRLETERKIRRVRKKSRGIYLIEDEKGMGKLMLIPDFGPIAAGIPLYLPDASFKALGQLGKNLDVSTVEIPESYLPAQVNETEVFALHVQGDSMRDAMLVDGDIVVLQRTRNVKPRDIVAAWIVKDQETTLKRIEFTERGIWLRPENPNYEPRFYLAGEVDIQGKLVAVLRLRG